MRVADEMGLPERGVPGRYLLLENERLRHENERLRRAIRELIDDDDLYGPRAEQNPSEAEMDRLEKLLEGLPSIVQEEDTAQLGVLTAKCRPLVFYARGELIAALRRLRGAP